MDGASVVGALIRQRRREKGIKAREVWEFTGVTKSTVWRWERGIGHISYRHRVLLARLLGGGPEEYETESAGDDQPGTAPEALPPVARALFDSDRDLQSPASVPDVIRDILADGWEPVSDDDLDRVQTLSAGWVSKKPPPNGWAEGWQLRWSTLQLALDRARTPGTLGPDEIARSICNSLDSRQFQIERAGWDAYEAERADVIDVLARLFMDTQVCRCPTPLDLSVWETRAAKHKLLRVYVDAFSGPAPYEASQP
jgi:transcriptional regulator with XRE-family HTH domain